MHDLGPSLVLATVLTLTACGPADRGGGEAPAPEASAPEAAEAAPPSTPVFDLEAEEYAFYGPSTLPSGWVTLRFENAGEQTHFLLLWKLPEGRTFDDYASQVAQPFEAEYKKYRSGELEHDAFLDELGGALPDWFGSVDRYGGAGFTAPGHTSQSTVFLEVGAPSLSADFARESPAGSGFRHRGEADASDGLFGASFLYQPRRWLGIRFGALFTDVSMSAATTCSPGPCVISVGRSVTTFDDVDWSVHDKSNLRMVFLEVPLSFEPSYRLGLFAGPTIADLQLSGVSASGPNGLELDADVSSPSFGLHAGGEYYLDRHRTWSVGLIGRWLPATLHYTVVQPFLSNTVPSLLRVSRDENLTMAALTIGHRFR